jgi:hypothetical protein
MKAIHCQSIRSTSLLAALAVGLLFPCAAQGQTPFTYQGKLENAGSAFTGTVHIRLSLYPALENFSPIRTETMANVAVVDGIFTVKPTTFTAADFPGAVRFLNIEVSSDGGSTYTALTPRQQVTWTPYALHAATAATVTGNVPAAQVTGTLNPGVIGTGLIGGSVTFNPASGSPFNVNGNTTKILNLNSDLIDGLDSAAFLQKVGGTMTGPLGIANTATVNFGNQPRQMINLYNADYGIGIQGDTLYQRSSSDWSWHRGGVHSDTRNDPGTDGTQVLRLTGNDLWIRPGLTGITATPPRLMFGNLNVTNNQPYVSIGEAPNLVDTLDITSDKVRMLSNTTGVAPSMTFGATTGQHVVLFENSVDTYGMGVQSGTAYFRTGDQFAWYRDGDHSDIALSPGGGTTLMTLSPNGTLTAKGTESGFNVVNRSDSTQEWALYSRDSGDTGQFAIWNNGTGDVAAFSPNGNLYLVGELTTTVLTVRGGADVAEPFEMTKPEEMEPGTVVVIDEENSGQLKKSTASYDKCVAGIISGAGGVKPGLRLHQEGVMEGDHHVALSGRVYVKADASLGKIKPGDLLTTSSTPGHAMKVKDHDQAQGAILGKAMSKLDSGSGLVLVLVTLQ